MPRITFEEYINNPTGARSRMVGEKDIAKKMYNDRYSKMLLRCAGNINYLLFRDKNPQTADSRFVIYIQMPSESTERLFYDVAIEFTAEDDVKRKINNLNAYHVRFFSNDPNFVYTYAYAFKNKDLLIPELISKISPKALKQAPHKTNPNETAGYVKSIYFAYLFMQSKGLFNKLMWINAASLTEMKKFFQQFIMTSDKKLTYAQQYAQLMKAKKLGDKTKLSANDEKSLEKAAKAAEHRTTMIKKVTKVNQTLQSKKVQKIKPIGRG